MKEHLACLIAGVFTIPLSTLIIRICAKKQGKKDYEEWIDCCRKYLYRIAYNFSNDCQSIAEKAFVQYTTIIQNDSYRHTPDYMTYSFLSDYMKCINALKEEYTDNVIKKLNEAMGRTTITTVPNFLIEEYSKQISDIHNAFSDFSYLMRKHIDEAKEKIN